MNGIDRGVWLAAALLTSIFVGIMIYGVFMRPAQVVEEAEDIPPKLEGVVKIGVMASHDEVYPVYEFIVDMAMRDINAYCADAGLDCSFEFLLSNANGTAANALDLTQMYKNIGIDLVVGYGWSSQLCVTRTYAEANGMVLLSPSSSSPQLAREDIVFRLCPHDFEQAAPMVRMMRSLGVTDAVVIQRRDSWGDGFAESFKRGFEEDGSRVQAVIRYPGEIVGDGFLPFVKRADAAIRDIAEKQGQDKAAVLLIGFSEDRQILELASSHPTLMGVRWFGSEEAVNSSGILESSCSIAADVGLIGPIPSTTENNVYLRVNRAFMDEFNRSLCYYDANVYDCCWVMALSVLEAGTANGEEVVKILSEVAMGFTGATGLCILDENGDRDAVDYDLWGFFDVDGGCRSLRCGTYYHESGSVEWDEALMRGATGVG